MFTDLNISFIFLSLTEFTYSLRSAATLSSLATPDSANPSPLSDLMLQSYHFPYFALSAINFLDLHFQALFAVSPNDIYLSHSTLPLAYYMPH